MRIDSFSLFLILVLAFLFFGCGAFKNKVFLVSETCPLKTISLTIHQGNINLVPIPGRDLGSGIFLPVKNIFNSDTKSSSSIYEDVHLNYCHITITSLNCFEYGQGGVMRYIWDSSNDENIHDSAMNIEIPENTSFTITLYLHEGCGLWDNRLNSYKRAIWMHQAYYDSAEQITIKEWVLNNVIILEISQNIGYQAMN